jgi:hypothetical protein
LGFIKDRPSASTDVVRPVPGGPRPALRLGVAKLRAPSALVVLPDFDGLLRSTPCRFVAPCFRPWGSQRFRFAPDARARRLGAACSASPVALHPSKRSPSQQVGVRHRAPRPSRRCSRSATSSPSVLPRPGSAPLAGHSTSGLCSAEKSVAPRRRCHRRSARCFLGLRPTRVLDAGIPRRGSEESRVARPGRSEDRSGTCHGIRRRSRAARGLLVSASGDGSGAIPPPREGLGGRRLPRRRSEELRADAAPAASDLSAGPKVGGRAALGAVLPKELVSAGWGPRSALRRGRLLGPEGGGSSLPKGGWACLGVPPGPPLWRRWCRRGLFRRPRRVGGSARLGAVGWGLRRVPRPPARGAGSDLSSASFFICLRRASDSWDSRGRRPKLVVSRDPARVSPGAEAPVRRRRSGGGCGARGAGPAWCVAWLVPKHQNLGPKPGAAVPCGTRRSLGDAALTPPLLVGGLWFLPRHEPRAASAAWGQPLPAWAEARAGGGPMKIEPLSCHVKDRFRRKVLSVKNRTSLEISTPSLRFSRVALKIGFSCLAPLNSLEEI